MYMFVWIYVVWLHVVIPWDGDRIKEEFLTYRYIYIYILKIHKLVASWFEWRAIPPPQHIELCLHPVIVIHADWNIVNKCHQHINMTWLYMVWNQMFRKNKKHTAWYLTCAFIIFPQVSSPGRPGQPRLLILLTCIDAMGDAVPSSIFCLLSSRM